MGSSSSASELRGAYANLRFIPDDLIEEGDKVVVRLTCRGTHRGEILGVAATESVLEWTCTDTMLLSHGKIAECWSHYDGLGWMQRVEDTTKALIQRWLDVLNTGNLDAVNQILADDGIYGDSHMPEAEVRGPEGFRRLVAGVRTAFPDIRYSLIGEPVLHGDRCSCRWTASATHKGEWLGVAPTGKHFTVLGTSTYRVRGGKIVELWSDWDALGMMQQLGVVPEVGHVMAAVGR